MNKKILIIEDEEMILSVLSKKLTDSGLDVILATDGETGLQKALTESPDLILLDIVLPKMDGITLLEKYNREQILNKAPIIILTNLDGADKIEESKKRGVFDYLVKTNWSLDDVVKKIKNSLGV
jgi:two-component system, OmpR family, alkaline phosphatase synthesis response regulator PhoP